MSITKYVCAAMHTESGGVPPQARAERVSRAAAWAESLSALLTASLGGFGVIAFVPPESGRCLLLCLARHACGL
jgi:hypothetical protein